MANVSRLSQSLWNAEAKCNWPPKSSTAWSQQAKEYERAYAAWVDEETVRRLVEELDETIMEVTGNG